MATNSATTVRSATPSESGGFVRWLAGSANNVAAYWVRREAIKALQALDDRRLRDIGLMRCQIKAAVKGIRPLRSCR